MPDEETTEMSQNRKVMLTITTLAGLSAGGASGTFFSGGIDVMRLEQKLDKRMDAIELSETELKKDVEYTREAVKEIREAVKKNAETAEQAKDGVQGVQRDVDTILREVQAIRREQERQR